MNSDRFIIRTDAGTRLGMGHFSRCLTLAGALLARGGRVEFAMVDPPEAVRPKIERAGAVLSALPGPASPEEDLARLLDLVRRRRAAGIILDGYHFDQAYLDGLADSVFTFFFDELMSFHYRVGVVLNQNQYPRPEDYDLGPRTRLLLGGRYAVLRPEFERQRALPRRDHPPRAERLLISFGGSDPENLTLRALRGLERSFLAYDVRVVLGPANRHVKEIEAFARQGRHRVRVEVDIDHMSALMAWADLALGASGTGTTNEMCCLGLPAVLVIQAENQRLIGEHLGRTGLARTIGWWERASGEDMARAVDDLAGDLPGRTTLSQRGMGVVDGRGAGRVAEVILEAGRGWRQ